MTSSMQGKQAHGAAQEEAGYMLLAVIVMVALMLIALAVAAPIVAKDLRRDKEVESEHRAEQYVRALRLYYRRLKTYPPSMDALEKSNNIRFLRQRYTDPLTGKDDWRLVHVGEQKTTVKGFFGEPLSGLQTSGIGSNAGMSTLGSPIGGSGLGSPRAGSSSLGSGTQGSAFGTSTGSSFGSSSTTTIGATSGLAAGFAGATIGSSTSGATGSTGATGSSGFGSGGLGQIMGVGSARTGESILTPNGQTTYDTWEFLYDPRIEQLYAKSNILGGGVATQSSSGFGKDATTALSGATGSTGSTGATGTTGSTGGTGATGTNGFTGSTGSMFSPVTRP